MHNAFVEHLYMFVHWTCPPLIQCCSMHCNLTKWRKGGHREEKRRERRGEKRGGEEKGEE